MKSFLIVLAVMLCAIFVIDSMELIKKAGSHIISFNDLLTISITKLPFIVQETFVFLIFFTCVHAFFFLARSNEYIAIRSSGISIWQFLMPLMIISVSTGILLVTVLNPFSTVLLNYSERLEKKVMGKDMSNSVSILGGEVWLFDKEKTGDEESGYIINAVKLKVESDITELHSPNFIFLDKNYGLVKIVSSKRAVLKEGNWNLSNYTEYIPRESPKVYPETYIVKNSLDIVSLQNNFKDPRGISIWELPYFMNILEATGYPTQKYYVYFYKLLAKPFLVPSIIFFAAAFALKTSRTYRTGVIIAGGMLAFILLYCAMELCFSVAFSNKIMQMINFMFVVLTLNAGGVFLVNYSEN